MTCFTPLPRWHDPAAAGDGATSCCRGAAGRRRPRLRGGATGGEADRGGERADREQNSGCRCSSSSDRSHGTPSSRAGARGRQGRSGSPSSSVLAAPPPPSDEGDDSPGPVTDVDHRLLVSGGSGRCRSRSPQPPRRRRRARPRAAGSACSRSPHCRFRRRPQWRRAGPAGGATPMARAKVKVTLMVMMEAGRGCRCPGRRQRRSDRRREGHPQHRLPGALRRQQDRAPVWRESQPLPLRLQRQPGGRQRREGGVAALDGERRERRDPGVRPQQHRPARRDRAVGDEAQRDVADMTRRAERTVGCRRPPSQPVAGTR